MCQFAALFRDDAVVRALENQGDLLIKSVDFQDFAVTSCLAFRGQPGNLVDLVLKVELVESQLV